MNGFYLDYSKSFFFNDFMANYRKLKVHEVGTDTYIDYEANVSDILCVCVFFGRLS